MKTILIVDDEVDMVDLLSMVLEDDGITLFVAYDGEEALEVVRREHPNLVLSDVMMPRLDGLRLCSEIRSNPATSDIVIILMTAARGLDLTSCDAYQVIGKPFDLSSVVGAVHHVLADLP